MSEAVMERIDTPRLCLRVMTAADEDLYCRLYTDPQVMRHLSAPLPWDVARRSFAIACRQAAERPMVRPWWVIGEAATRSDVGVIGLTREGAAAEMGIVLLPPSQGNGIGLEALAALARHAMASGLADEIWVCHSPGNLAVARIAQRLGFRRESDGSGPDSCRWRGTRSDAAPTAERACVTLLDEAR
jgi:RimJ/RimL family protein N-acetyltransferase